MDQLDELFQEMINERVVDIRKALKNSILTEVVFLTYELLMKKAVAEQEVDRQSILELVIKEIDELDDGS